MVRPLIDASVKSGSDTEYRESIHLLGGRVYPLRLEFSRGKEKRSSVSLLWKPPHRDLEVIPRGRPHARRVPGDLRPQDAVPARRSQRRLRARDVDLEGVGPGDDRRGAGSGRLRRGPPQGPGRGLRQHAGEEREPKLRDFCGGSPSGPSAGRCRTSRRRSSSTGSSRRAATRDGREAGRAAGPQVAAVPLSRAGHGQAGCLRRGVPALVRPLGLAPRRDAVGGRRLRPARHPRAGRRARPGALVADLRARAKLREFFLQWLRVDQGPEVAKDPKLFPGFDEAVVSDLRSSLELFLDDVIGSEAADFRQLLHADYLYLNGRLARFYGVDLPADAPFQKVNRKPQRAGRRPDASLPALQLRLHGVELAHPSRGVRLPERPGPVLRPRPRPSRPWPPTFTRT